MCLQHWYVVCCMCTYVYLGDQRAMVPAWVLLYSRRLVRFGMAEGCAQVDGMLPASRQTSVSVAAPSQALSELSEGWASEDCTLASLTCQSVVCKQKVLDIREPGLPLWQSSLHRRQPQSVVSMLQRSCMASKVYCEVVGGQVQVSKLRAQSAPAVWNGACTHVVPFTEISLEETAGMWRSGRAAEHTLQLVAGKAQISQRGGSIAPSAGQTTFQLQHAQGYCWGRSLQLHSSTAQLPA